MISLVVTNLLDTPVTGEKTEKYMGVKETILSTSISGVLFGLFSAQPMMILGATGPVLVFEESLHQVRLFNVITIYL